MDVNSGERALFNGSAGGSMYTFVCLPNDRYGVRVDGRPGQPWDVSELEACLAEFLRLVRVHSLDPAEP